MNPKNFDERLQTSNWLRQALTGLCEANAEALALLTTAIARQLDAAKLTADLRATLQAAQATKSVAPLSLRLAKHALAAAEAESLHQRTPPQPTNH